MLSRIHGHINIQMQGNVYTHVIWITVYMSVCVYAGMLNYETVYHKSSLLGIWYTCIIKLYIKQIHWYVELSDGDWSIFILAGIRQMKVWLRLL